MAASGCSIEWRAERAALDIQDKIPIGFCPVGVDLSGTSALGGPLEV